jgi:hypothetical protein
LNVIAWYWAIIPPFAFAPSSRSLENLFVMANERPMNSITGKMQVVLSDKLIAQLFDPEPTFTT